MPQDESILDCIVVGGGLSGLAAADALADRYCMLLEREDRAGGRVYTVRTAYGALDLGACFALHPEVFPPGVDLQLEVLPERGPIVLCTRGERLQGDTAWECLQRARLPGDSWAALESFREGAIDASALPEDAYRLVEAFFRQIHAGRLDEYVRDRQSDAFLPLYPKHFTVGNGAAVDAYLEGLPGVVRTGLVVTRIEEDDTGVDVFATCAATRVEERLRARYLVLATTADVARGLVVPSTPERRAFIESVVYATYVHVAIEVHAPQLERFRAIVAPESPLNVVLQQGTADGAHRSLYCYYSDPIAQTMASYTDDQLVRMTMDHLATLAGPTFAGARITTAAVRRWPAVTTVLSPTYRESKAAFDGQATPRVFLAGDYAYDDPTWGYGTIDAVRAGRRAADRVLQALDDEDARAVMSSAISG